MIERKDNIIFGDNWDELGIEVPNGKQFAVTNTKLKRCPECERLGKKHLNDSSISIIPATGIGKCHKCGTKYIVRRPKEKKEYKLPVRTNLTVLKADGLKFLTDRKISQDAIKRLKLTQENTSVAFGYLYEGELVNIKYRWIGKKGFHQSPGGMHIVYNYDNVKEYMESSGDFRVAIVEGECDVAAMETAGIHFAVSLDSGAIGVKDKDIEGKLECITNAQYIFDLAEIIYIAVDNDENGRRTTEELKRRFPTQKIRIVNFGVYKDANDVLMFDESLPALLEKASEIKMEGIFYASDVEQKLKDNYKHGLPKGTTTYLPSVDARWKWRLGEVTILTGYANEGKTVFINFLLVLKAIFEGWKAAIFSPENFPPEEFYEDVIHSFKGKSSDREFSGRMTEAEFNEGIEFVNKHFFLVYPEKHSTLQELFDRFDYLIQKFGVKVIVIDPYNQVEHFYEKGEREDLYISRFMAILKRFAVSRNVEIILIVHQNKPTERTDDGNYPPPSMYNIKGGGTFADKADNVVTYYRPLRLSDDSNGLVIVESHKIKKKKLTGVTGQATIYFDWKSNQFKDPALDGRSPMEPKLAYTPSPNIGTPKERKLELFE